MMKETKACDLCGLTVEVKGFELATQEGLKVFCCEGCKGIYEMLHEDIILSNSVSADQTKKEED